MALADELNEEFLRQVQGAPWVIRVMTGEVTSADEISTEELIHGLTIAVIALHKNLLRVAEEIDASR